ncbi:hypothetical protein [Heliophilum fasciatum]|uniref:Minor structural protein GP20 n=1 Tax=Heliophilum fasciatum TaxID=35700 RepID=A0A4R2RNB3_9FIRM|nr:hypothetical protein [Heliophilum fasciatum]MCW2279101.1 ribonucleoside-triphosphate reductase [Heliophilum fasciatum]TCP61271.1 hypothetical protein EDD73_12924 [Heliophilum fasciatum]
MVDETTVKETQPTATETPKEPTKAPEHQIPKARFDEVNAKYKEAQTQLEQLLSEREAQAKTAKEQQGKFEELYKSTADELTRAKDGHKTSTARVQQLESVIQGLLNVKLEGIPKEFHDLVPANLPPEAQLEWLASAEKKGLFGHLRQEQPVGQATNPAKAQTVDLDQLTPLQLLKIGYSQRA